MSVADSSVEIHLNGEARMVPVECPLAELIENLGLSPQTALVEHNGQALFRADWDHVRLAQGDRVEVLRVVAGG